MMKLASRVAMTAVATLLLAGAASAQTPAPTTTTTTPAAKTAPAAPTAKKAEKPRTEASLECSKQADAKGLHGADRRKFRSECKKGAKTN